MAQEGTEQDKSEAATPFKLDRARRRGLVARGMDLSFVASLIAVAIIAQTTGARLFTALAQETRRTLVGGIASAAQPAQVGSIAYSAVSSVVAVLIMPLFLLLAVCVGVDLIQNRGLIFSAEPLKPDFSRLNPAAGFKRLFSFKLLKEMAKSVLKLALYSGAAYLFIRGLVAQRGVEASSGANIPHILVDAGARLLFLFVMLAAFIAVLDQLLARRDFANQMRMSKREITREAREREGEPRQKRKRKQILAEILKQAAAAANVKGADVLIVNPTHFAVALRYTAQGGDAPVVQARGRNFWAQRMRRSAEREGITIVRHPTLARALYREGEVGRMIAPRHYVAVADIYIALRRALKQSA